MPLSHLGELLEFACKEEVRLAKCEQEKTLFPLWLVSYGIGKLKNTPMMSFEEFLDITRNTKTPSKTNAKRTAEEILTDFLPIIEADRKRGE